MPKILYDVSLGGVSIHSLADEIIVRDIVEKPAKMDMQTSKRALHAGTRVANHIRRSLSVDVVYVIRAEDSERRAEIAGLIAGWVGSGGWLEISTRPGKRLYVRPSDFPSLGSSLRWTEDITMTLTAYEQPYWEDKDDVSVGIAAAWSDANNSYYGANVIKPAGNVEKVPLTLMAWNTGDENPITYIKIVADSTFFEFENIHLEPGGMFAGMLEIVYTDDDVLSIKDFMMDVSLMGNRTAESSDDLLVRCGKNNQLHVYADGPCQVFFYAKGRWL